LSREPRRHFILHLWEKDEKPKSLKGSECLQKLRRNIFLTRATKLRVEEFVVEKRRKGRGLWKT